MNRIRQILEKDLQIVLKKNKKTKSADLWDSRIYKSCYFSEASSFYDELKNFRKNTIFLTEEPRFEKNFFSNFYPWKYLHYKVLEEDFQRLNNYEKKMLKSKLKFNHVGNPYYAEESGIKYNKRWLNHIHYNYLINKNIKDMNDKKKKIVCDIGGGYGISGYMLKKNRVKGTFILVDFGKQLISAKYFFLKSFNKIKINDMSDAYGKSIFTKNYITKFDVFLCPVENFNKLQIKLDLLINTFSLGEMKNKIFKKYLNSDIFKNSKYIFYVNRVNSQIEYKNKIMMSDYNLHQYKKLHFDINLLNTHYVKRFLRYFGIKQRVNSEIFEYIGKNKKFI